LKNWCGFALDEEYGNYVVGYDSVPVTHFRANNRAQSATPSGARDSREAKTSTTDIFVKHELVTELLLTELPD
jgi:hypothetical protein